MSKTKTTPAEAEELAKQVVQQYLNQCQTGSREHIGNCLMKLCSVAGVIMALAEGSEIAATRLDETANFVRLKMPRKPARMEPLQ